jgi:pyruvate-formate lyase-activating enzyme
MAAIIPKASKPELTTIMTAQPNLDLGTNNGQAWRQPIIIGRTGVDNYNSGEGFDQFHFNDTDFGILRRLAGRPSPVVGEVFGIIANLARRPVGAFDNVVELCASVARRTESGPSFRAIRLLQDWFLSIVNERLQEEVYRRHFRSHPPQPHARHDEKIAALESTRAQAQAVLDSYDWNWLAHWLQLERIGESANSCLRRLSNFAFPVHSVNFRFTYHCNISCRHCYNSSGPHLKAQNIALDSMLAIVAEMPDVGIGHLNLTGGEPFLYPSHLTTLIAAGRAAGLYGININTNGYWALSADHARRMLERLSAAGFMQGSGDRLKASTGIYHQEFVDFDRILTMARSYHELFGKPLTVDFEFAPGDTTTREPVLQRVRDAGLIDKIELLFRNVSPMGRGKELDGIAMHPVDSPCNVINQIVFDPDGSARPCCGLNNENQGVIIGRLKTHRLGDLVKSMQNDPVLQFLARNPMSAIFEHVAKPKNLSGYSDHCHLCQDALGSLTDKEPLQAAMFEKQQFYPFWFALSGQEGVATFQASEACDEID